MSGIRFILPLIYDYIVVTTPDEYTYKGWLFRIRHHARPDRREDRCRWSQLAVDFATGTRSSQLPLPEALAACRSSR
jgi:hypothetical protein